MPAIIVIVLALTGFLGFPDHLLAEPWSPPVWTAPEPPPVTAKAAFVIDTTAGVPLYSRDADKPLPPASLVKIATAAVVLEHGNLDDSVEITPADVVDETQSRVGLLAGDRLSVRDLLFGLLIPSGNDAALALARHVGATLPGGDADPIGAFVDEMNRWAADNGAATARFENPVGLSGETQRASARDLATMATVMMADPLFAEIVGTPKVVLPSILRPEGYTIVTTNDMLVDGTAIGVKTGTLPEAGGCVVVATRVSGNLVISVVLGSALSYDEAGNPKSPSRFTDTRMMLAAAQEDYVWIDPADGAVPGLDAELAAWNARVAAPVPIPVPAASAGALTYRLRLGPPASTGGSVGDVLFLVDGALLGDFPMEQA